MNDNLILELKLLFDTVTKQRGRKKKEREENEHMFHLVSYWWFRRTQYIPELGGFY